MEAPSNNRVRKYKPLLPYFGYGGLEFNAIVDYIGGTTPSAEEGFYRQYLRDIKKHHKHPDFKAELARLKEKLLSRFMFHYPTQYPTLLAKFDIFFR